MVAGEHAWLLGVCGCRGHAWLLGVCVVARGACVVAGAWLWGACVGYDEIRSMSRRYASYWNAFLCNFDINRLNIYRFLKKGYHIM